MKNVIILGAGRTGSSFLSGLISYNRFYINREMIATRDGYPDGDYENPELINLNKRILLESGYGYDKAFALEPADIDSIRQYAKNIKNTAFETFVTKCDQNRPWLWKDPRLCYTIFFWQQFIDITRIRFIKITRDPYLVFRSHSKNRIKHLKRELYKNYAWQTRAVDLFLTENSLNALHIDYAELKSPAIIHKINDYLGTDISREDYFEIKKDNISKKESRFKFLLRYAKGAGKIYLQKLHQNQK